MESDNDSHEYSDGWPSSSLASSHEDPSESDLDEETDQSAYMGQSWSGNPHQNTTAGFQHLGPPEPQASNGSVVASLLRHHANSPTAPPLHNTLQSRTLPPLRTLNSSPRSRPSPRLSRPVPDIASRSRDLPSSHLQLPRFGVFEDLLPISPAASLSSSESWPGSLPSLTQSEFVDLTNEFSPPLMASTTRTKRRASHSVPSDGLSTAGSSAKRRKTGAVVKGAGGVKKESDPPEIDLTQVNNGNTFDKVLETQQEKAIKAQREEQGDMPAKLSGLQCIICLETMTNITVTGCGHLFCHTCLLESLIAGEQQEQDNGKSFSRCPVCRKRVVRPKAGKENQQVIPVEVKLATESKMAKRRPKASGAG